MKLISMIDFVLERNLQGLRKHQIKQVRQYAKFLKQPLTLGMFVPCDEEGNALEEPKWVEPMSALLYGQLQTDYQKAKEKVLFENIKKVHFSDPSDLDVTIEIQGCGFDIDLDQTIQSLIFIDLELTPTALKQIGL